MGCSIDRVRQILRDDCGGRVELLLNAKKIQKLKKLSASPEGKQSLSDLKRLYAEHRKRWGYVS